jgi:hypothetical protein
MLRKRKKMKIGRGRRKRNINVTLNDPFTLTYSLTYSACFLVVHKKYEGSQKKEKAIQCMYTFSYLHTHTHVSTHAHTHMSQHTHTHAYSKRAPDHFLSSLFSVI